MDLASIAESNAQALWIVETHVAVGDPDRRQRCPICEQWWPCDLVGLAALAVMHLREGERLRVAFIRHRTMTHEVAPKHCKTCGESDVALYSE